MQAISARGCPILIKPHAHHCANGADIDDLGIHHGAANRAGLRLARHNTICLWAHGISDTYALGVLAEATGLGVPVVVLPFVNTALASRAPFRRSVESLRAEGVKVLLGPGGFQPPRYAPAAA